MFHLSIWVTSKWHNMTLYVLKVMLINAIQIWGCKTRMIGFLGLQSVKIDYKPLKVRFCLSLNILLDLRREVKYKG